MSHTLTIFWLYIYVYNTAQFKFGRENLILRVDKSSFNVLHTNIKINSLSTCSKFMLNILSVKLLHETIFRHLQFFLQPRTTVSCNSNELNESSKEEKFDLFLLCIYGIHEPTSQESKRLSCSTRRLSF